MSFQAPDSDTDAVAGGFKAPDDDFAPSFLGKTASNILPDLKETATNIGGMIKEGAYDMPKRALETGVEMAGGTPYAETPSGQKDTEFVENAPEMGKEMARPVTHPVDYFQEHPVQQTMNVLGALGAAKAMRGVPRGTIAPEVPAAAAEAPKGLPVIEPGAKTGAPHALFSYNDEFGPGGKPRSQYTMFGDPEHPVFKQKSPGGAGGHGSTVSKADLDALGVPVTGREPRTVGKWEPLESTPDLEKIENTGPKPEPASRMPPDPNAPPPKTATPKPDPLQDVKDYLAKTQGKIESQPGWQEKAAKYVKNEVADLRAKDIGMRDPMIRSLDPKRPLEALKKAEDLMSYANENGYFKPGLTNIARKDMIASKIGETGKNIGAVRTLGSQRAQPPIPEIRQAIQANLEENYGGKAGREIKTVLGDFDRMVKKDPSFQGLADVSTYLNGEKHTFNKIGQNPGPTTDAANILSRMNNEALRKVLSPEENDFYTKNLRDFGAHKKLEQMVASAGRRGMTGRGAPGGALSSLWQQLWDRGGYRMAGNVADRMSTSVLKNPGKIKTLPDFFEELAHHAGDELDDTIQAVPAMSKGGRVPDDVRNYVSRGC